METQKPRRRKNKNRGRNQAQQKPRPPEFIPQKVDFGTLPCVICGKEIQDLPSAIAFDHEGGPAHLECVLEHLKNKENLLEGESLVYHGAGSFAIIKESAGFELQRKIVVENKDIIPEWKKEIKRKALSLIPAFTE